MKTWQEALKILLEEIDLSVADLAQMTDTHATSIFKYLQGINNSKSGTVQAWVDACERHHKGSRRRFYLLCMGEPIEPIEKKTIRQHVDEMSAEQMSDYLKEIGRRLGQDSKKNKNSQPNILRKAPPVADFCQSDLKVKKVVT